MSQTLKAKLERPEIGKKMFDDRMPSQRWKQALDSSSRREEFGPIGTLSLEMSRN